MDPAEVPREEFAALVAGARALSARCALSPASFFSATIIDPEHPDQRRPMRVAAHQEVAAEFVLAHSRGVIRWPTDTGKTLFTVSLLLWLLGRNPSASALAVGKTEQIAKKPLSLVRQYLEDPDLNARVRMIFPALVRSSSPAAEWSSTSLTIERPEGSADPSLTAIGMDTGVQGRKATYIVADDLLDADNTHTPEQRSQLKKKFFARINSRLVPGADTKVFVVNVPWYEDEDSGDLTFELEKRDGWPTLHMDIYGNVRVANTDWTTPLLRESALRAGWYRLARHDPDAEDRVPLMPERWPSEAIEDKRSGKNAEPPSEFARSRLCQPTSTEEARCKLVWLDGGLDDDGYEYPGCKVRGTRTVERIKRERLGQTPVYVGIDPATGEGKDRHAMAAIGLDPDGRRLLLKIESGKWQIPEQARRAVDWADRYGADLAVESNGYQKTLKQLILAVRPDLRTRVVALDTSEKKKDSVVNGLEAIFAEFSRGEWAIPCDERGQPEPEIKAFIDECVAYRPGQHPGDRLMAVFVARQRAHARIMALMRGKQPRKNRSIEEAVSDLGRLNPQERWRGPAVTRSAGYSIRRGSGAF